MNGNLKDSLALIVSIGTGQSAKSRFTSKSKGRLKKYITYLQAAQHLAVDSESVHKDMESILAANGESKKYYRFNVRSKPTKSRLKNLIGSSTMPQSSPLGNSNIRPRGGIRRRNSKPLGNMKLDEWKPESRFFRRDCNTTLRDIVAATDEYLENQEVQEQLEKVAKMLVDNRRLRCEKELWEIASTGTLYRCMYDGCHSFKSQKMRSRKRSLISHLQQVHGIKDSASIDDFVQRGRCRY